MKLLTVNDQNANIFSRNVLMKYKKVTQLIR